MTKITEPAKSQLNFRRLVVYSLIGFGFLAIFLWVVSTQFWNFLEGGESLDVVLHANRQADYSPDRQQIVFPKLDLRLVSEVIEDQNPGLPELKARLTEVYHQLQTPVPTATQSGTGADQTPTSSPTSSTPVEITASLTPESGDPSITPPTAFPTATTSAFLTTTPSATLLPTNTPLLPSSTNTPLPPTDPPPTATFTPAPPTSSPTATMTSMLPTSTSPPPTATQNVCQQLSLTNGSAQSNQIKWQISNSSTSSVTISGINISWPEDNGALDKIFFKGAKIWDGSSQPPSANISSGWSGPSTRRTLSPSSSGQLRFLFTNQISSSGYSIRINFSNGCNLSGSR